MQVSSTNILRKPKLMVKLVMIREFSLDLLRMYQLTRSLDTVASSQISKFQPYRIIRSIRVVDWCPSWVKVFFRSSLCLWNNRLGGVRGLL